MTVQASPASWAGGRTLPGTLSYLALASAVVGIVGYWALRFGAEQWFVYMADDAFYYFVVARNLARDGVSSFDGLVLTNGYQPLWQALLAVESLLHPASFAPVVFIECAALFGALLLAFRESGRSHPWMMCLLAALLAGLLGYPLVLDGMETELLFLAFAAFFCALAASARSHAHSHKAAGWPLAVLAAAVVGARIDAAVFVAPAIVLAPIALRDKRRSLALLVVAGLVYAGVNQAVFGTPLPVSGSAKSLGGFGLNRLLLQQIGEAWTGNDGSLIRGSLSFIRGLPGQTIWMAAITFLLLVAQRDRSSFAGRLAMALLIGFGLYAVRLMFFSSWRVWEWYAYPVFPFLLVDVSMIAALLEDKDSAARRILAALAVAAVILGSSLYTWREAILAALVLVATWSLLPRPRLATTLLGLALTASAALSMSKSPPHPNALIALFSKPAAQQVRAVTGGAAVAASDFAGAFAYYYGGPVSQLEGLVNDIGYLDAVRRHQPIEPLLCARGVRYIVSYQKEIGDYGPFVYRPLRPFLTSFEGPAISFRPDDEVARITNASQYGVSDPAWRIYVWRLRSCTG